MNLSPRGWLFLIVGILGFPVLLLILIMVTGTLLGFADVIFGGLGRLLS